MRLTLLKPVPRRGAAAIKPLTLTLSRTACNHPRTVYTQRRSKHVR